MKINMNLLPIKAHYFLIFAGTAPILPFLPVYARQLGISAAGIGLIYTVLPFVGLFAKAVSGAIADWLRIHRVIFLSSIAVMAVGFFSVHFAPAVPQKPNPTPQASAKLNCSQDSLQLTHCFDKQRCGKQDFINTIDDNTTTNCYVKCDIDHISIDDPCRDWGVECPGPSFNFTATTNLLSASVIDSCTFFPIDNISIGALQVEDPTCTSESALNCSVLCDSPELMTYLDAPPTLPPATYDELLGYSEFWVYMMVMIVAWTGLAIATVMSDTICFQLLGAEANRFGEQRLFGSIGWGLLVVISGAAIDYASQGSSQKDYTPAFVLCICILFIDLLAASKLKVSGTEKGRVGAGAVIRLMCEPRIVLFVLCCVVVGLSTGILWTFQLMLVEDVALTWDCHFPNQKLLEGLIMGVQCFGGELPFFFLSGWFIERLTHIHCMSLVIFVFGVRYVLYYTIVNPWLFLPIELLNGFTFGIFYATMTSYASLVAPPGTEATMQGIVGAAFEGIGVALGGFVGGSLFFTVGGSYTFLYTGVFNIVFAIIHISLQLLLNYMKPTESQTGDSSPNGYIPPSESMRPVAVATEEPTNEEEENLPVNP